jgi:hypothetical protein
MRVSYAALSIRDEHRVVEVLGNEVGLDFLEVRFCRRMKRDPRCRLVDVKRPLRSWARFHERRADDLLSSIADRHRGATREREAKVLGLVDLAHDHAVGRHVQHSHIDARRVQVNRLDLEWRSDLGHRFGKRADSISRQRCIQTSCP